MLSGMSPDDYYVEVLEAADVWFDLVHQEEDATDAEWDSVLSDLGDAVEALREYEASEGTSIRDEPWGNQRDATFGVIDAADAWQTLSDQEDEPAPDVVDAVFDRLGEAVLALRTAHDQHWGLL